MANQNNQSNNVVKLLIVDDHQLFREGLKRIINMEEDLSVIGECGDGIRAIELCNTLHPDVVLMDINMPVENGVAATERLRDIFPEIKVVILSIHDDESYVFETLRKGATGYLLKDMEAEALIEAIRTVYAGNSYIHPKVTGKLINQLRRMTYLDQNDQETRHEAVPGYGQGQGSIRGDGDPRDQQDVQGHKGGASAIAKRSAGARNTLKLDRLMLTKREMDVLLLLAEGKSNRQIGECLDISEKTVKNHVSGVLQKLDVGDRTQAAILAIKNDWVNQFHNDSL